MSSFAESTEQKRRCTGICRKQPSCLFREAAARGLAVLKEAKAGTRQPLVPCAGGGRGAWLKGSPVLSAASDSEKLRKQARASKCWLHRRVPEESYV